MSPEVFNFLLGAVVLATAQSQDQVGVDNIADLWHVGKNGMLEPNDWVNIHPISSPSSSIDPVDTVSGSRTDLWHNGNNGMLELHPWIDRSLSETSEMVGNSENRPIIIRRVPNPNLSSNPPDMSNEPGRDLWHNGKNGMLELHPWINRPAAPSFSPK